MVVAAASLFLISYLALGALLQLLVRDLATGLGLTGLVVSPAFGYAGVGFPILGMNALAALYALLALLRLRSLAKNLAPPATAPQLPAAAAPHGLGGAFVAEWRRV